MALNETFNMWHVIDILYCTEINEIWEIGLVICKHWDSSGLLKAINYGTYDKSIVLGQ